MSATVIAAAGIIIPAIAATTPRQPCGTTSDQPGERYEVIPGQSCESAQASPNSRALIQRPRSTARRRISSKVLVPPPTDCAPTVTHERIKLANMPVNLAVMDMVGRQEAPVFTWNPVEQMWVQERGGAAKPPPAPHDVHAIQTWFFDADENEWIQTVLGPMGRQLAEQWRGAYRVPDGAISRETKTKPKAQPKTKAEKTRSPLPILVSAVILIALIGGVAVAAPGIMNSNPSPAPSAPIPASSVPGPGGSTAPTAAPTSEPTPEPTGEPATPAPATRRPTARPVTTPRRPAGPSVTFGNGTTVVYTGPLSVIRSAYLPGTFTVILANGGPGQGVFTIMLGNLSQPLRTVFGSLDPAKGTIAMDVPATLPAGSWPLYFMFEGATVQIATITVR